MQFHKPGSAAARKQFRSGNPRPKKRAWALIRKDTENYGWVLSRHATQEAAEKAYDRKSLAVTKKYPTAIPHLMWCVREVEPTEKKGTRLRI